jgi:hypothetical protein
MDSDHNKYDAPEPQEETTSRGAIVVLGLLYVIATGEVPWR